MFFSLTAILKQLLILTKICCPNNRSLEGCSAPPPPAVSPPRCTENYFWNSHCSGANQIAKSIAKDKNTNRKKSQCFNLRLVHFVCAWFSFSARGSILEVIQVSWLHFKIQLIAKI